MRWTLFRYVEIRPMPSDADRKWIVVRLDVLMALRKIKGTDLAERVGLTQSNLNRLKTGQSRPSASRPWWRSAASWSASQGIC